MFTKWYFVSVRRFLCKRIVCINVYIFDPCHFYYKLRLTWSAALGMTKIELELSQLILKLCWLLRMVSEVEFLMQCSDSPKYVLKIIK